MGALWAPVKYHYFHRFFTYSMRRRRAFPAQLLALEGRRWRGRSGSKTVSGGEFGWGGTSVKR